MTEDKERNCKKFFDLERKGCRSFIFIGQPIGNKEMMTYIKKHEYDYIGMNVSYQVHVSSLPEECDKSFNLNEENAFFEYLKIFQKQNIGNYRILMPDPYFNNRFSPFLPDADRELFRKNWVDTPSCEFSDSDGFEERYQNAYSAMRREYQKDPDIRGVICITDYHALGAAHFFHDAGRKVGEDVLVCGMFNTSAARFSLLPIITSGFDIKQTASQMLNHLFAPEPVHVIVNPKIIIPRRNQS